MKIAKVMIVFLIFLNMVYGDEDFSIEIKNLKSEGNVENVVLTWDKINNDNALGIEILRKSGDESFKKIAVLKPEVISFTADKQEPLGKFTYKIKIIYKNGKKSKGVETTAIVKHSNVVWDEYDGKKLLVYLPDGYEMEKEAYPVLYMFDGQNIFSESLGSPIEWMVDENISNLVKQGLMQKIIVVGIFNAGEKRHEEYYARFFDNGKNFSEWLAKKLTGYIEKKYRTKNDRENRGVMGSSAGGYITLYMLDNYPEYFGFGAALSLYEPWKMEELSKIKNNNQKVWIDAGTAEYMSSNPLNVPELETHRPYSYPEAARKIVSGSLNAGLKYGTEIVYYEVDGGTHSEFDWQSRVKYPLIMFKGLKRESKPTEIDIKIEAIRNHDYSTEFIVNPIADFDNGIRYSLFTNAEYKITGKNKIEKDGSFTLNDEEAVITVIYEGIKKEVKITKKELEYKASKINPF